MAPISIIIPTLDAADRLGPCLGAVGEALFDGVVREVIFADGGSADTIAEVADGVGARLIDAPRGRGTQLAAGAEAAVGEWLFFLHADTVLPEGWADAVRTHMAQHPDKAGWFRLAFDAKGAWPRWVAGWANWRSRWLGLPYGDQGLLVSRRLYEEVGGYPAIPLMEDVAIARRLRGRLRGLSGVVTTSAARYQRDGWFRRGRRNLGTLLRYFLGVAPERLVERYRR